MDMGTLFLLALGLSMDAFAVSVSNSMAYKGLRTRQAAVNSATFGLFQGVMPLLGFFAGRLFAQAVQAVDHWLAVVLLGFIGGKMIVEGIKALRSKEECKPAAAFSARVLLTQALATSIDALAVGISFAALAVNIWYAVAFIAVVTTVCSFLGSLLGKSFGALLGEWAEVLGGVILVGIGLRIFIEHMWF